MSRVCCGRSFGGLIACEGVHVYIFSPPKKAHAEHVSPFLPSHYHSFTAWRMFPGYITSFIELHGANVSTRHSQRSTHATATAGQHPPHLLPPGRDVDQLDHTRSDPGDGHGGSDMDRWLF
mgnify:CR=1 FL=1